MTFVSLCACVCVCVCVCVGGWVGGWVGAGVREYVRACVRACGVRVCERAPLSAWHHVYIWRALVPWKGRVGEARAS